MAGDVDGAGASARFNRPFCLTLDEGGRLLVLEIGNRRRMRVVEASLMPPPHLAAKVQSVTQDLLKEDYGKLLGDTELADVTFAVDGQRFPAHRCVLSARSAYFRGLFKSGKGMREGGGGAAAATDIIFEEVSVGAFRVLLRFLYACWLPEEEDCGEGLGPGEMARVADRFQALELFEHCVRQFEEGLEVGNVVARLVQAHDSGLAPLQEAAMRYFQAHALAFHVSLYSHIGVYVTCVYLCAFVRVLFYVC